MGRPRWAALGSIVILAAAVSPFASPPTKAEAPTPNPALEVSSTRGRPNIVVIMADDMRRDELKWMPTVRQLIRDRGVTFTNSFAPYPLCCPSRASFMKGQYAHNHGVLGNMSPFGFRSFKDRSTIATDLRRSGYATVFLGKYLNGYGEQRAPDGSGGSRRYIPPGWTSWLGAPEIHRAGALSGSPYHYRKTTLNINGTLVPHRGKYQTKLFGGLSENVIERRAAASKPFFFWASYVAPHFGQPTERDDLGRTPAVTRLVRDKFDDLITSPSGAGEADVSDKPGFIQALQPVGPERLAAITEHYRQRAEALRLLDHQIAKTMAALRRAGELSNTYVIFTSDNGYLLGEHRVGGKILPYEESLRVPLMIRGPGIPAGVTRTDPALTIDLAPTILQAARTETVRVMDGRSLLPIARQGDIGWRRAVLTETGPLNQLDPWMRNATTDPAPKTNRFGLGLRTPDYLYVRWASNERELYDLAADPKQLVNVIDDPTYETVRQLLAEHLTAIRDCSGVDCRLPLPPSLTNP